jgi:hypothetical protein
MSRRKTQSTKAHAKSTLRKQIAAHVAVLFPSCTAEFVGQQSRARLVARTFGFRVKDERGKYKSNIVWLDPAYQSRVSQAWVEHAVSSSNN